MLNPIIFTLLFSFLFILMLSKKNPIDLFFLAFNFMGLYSLPLALGGLPGNHYIPSEEIEPFLYVFFSFALFFIVCTSFFYELKIKPVFNQPKNRIQVLTPISLADKFFFHSLSFLFFSVLAFYLFTKGGGEVTKGDVLKNGGIKLVLLETIAIIMVSFSCIRMSKLYIYLSYFCLIIVFYLFGVRSVIVISGLVVVFFHLNKKKSINIYIVTFYFIAALLSLFVIVILKPVYGFILGNESDFLLFFSNVTSGEGLLSGVEFFMTQHIFNSVVMNDFIIPWWEVPLSLMSISPIPTELLGFRTSLFNDLFQPALYPNVPYGMAYNPWAEAYSWGRSLGLVIYLILFLLVICISQSFIDKKPNSVFIPLIMIIAIFTVFYIQRNSLGSYLGYIRNYIYLYTLMIIFSQAASKCFIKRRL